MKEQLEKLIMVLSEHNFNILIKEYAKLYYSSNEVNIINGPYDGGNDLVYYRNNKAVKRNIQITVQQSQLEGKIISDLKKSSENVKTYSYVANLDFYSSRKLSEEFKKKFIRQAEIDYSIELKFIDAGKIADDTDSFPILIDLIYELHGIATSPSDIKLDQQTRVLLNMLTISDDTSALKKQFIHSIILLEIFASPKSLIETIFLNVGPKLPGNYDINKLKNRLDYLKSQNHLIYEKGQYTLTEETHNQIVRIFKGASQEEEALLFNINKILLDFGIDEGGQDILKTLSKLYQQHFKSEIDEVYKNKSKYHDNLRSIFEELLNFFTKQGIGSDEKREELVTRLISTCSENEYLQKTGMSYMYISLLNSNKLDIYLNKGVKILVLDAQILLRMLCTEYKFNAEYNDLEYGSVSLFFESTQESSLEIDYSTYFHYVEEVYGHIRRGLILSELLDLKLFDGFSNSDNVFFNYWNFLKQKGLNKGLNLENFILKELLGISDKINLKSPDIKKTIVNRLSKIYNSLGLEIVNIPYSNNKLSEIKRQYEIKLYNRTRRAKTINNDVQTAMFLGDKNNEKYSTHDMTEVYFITWDTSFYDLREIVANTEGYTSWYIYPPLKFSEKIDMINFKINPKIITYNLISLVESIFNKGQNNASFLDVMSMFFEKGDISNLSLAKKVVNLEEKLLQERPPKESEKQKETPLLQLLLNVHEKYTSSETDHTFEHVIDVFSNAELSEPLFKLLSQEVQGMMNEKHITKEFYTNLDKIISTWLARIDGIKTEARKV